MDILLYHTAGCHLCELAETILDDVVSNTKNASFNVILKDIALDDSLIEQFGTYIPVIKHADTTDLLYWPFDYASLDAFLNSKNG